MTKSTPLLLIATLALSVAIPSCATPAPDSPPEPGAPAVATWSWSPRSGEFVGEPESIWVWTLHVVVPGDDLEFDLRIDSDPKLVEGGWIDPCPDLRFARSSEIRGEGHPILFFPPDPPELYTRRRFDSIDNPATSFFWMAPREPFAVEPVAVEPDTVKWHTDVEYECPPPDPPNCEVPRKVLDRLVSVRDSSSANVYPISADDVVMTWALAFLRSEFAKSSSQ